MSALPANETSKIVVVQFGYMKEQGDYSDYYEEET